METKTINVQEAQKQLEKLLAHLSVGEEIIITDGKIPIARLVPISSRIPGLHKGAIWVSPDFDEPLPEEFWTGDT